MTRSTAMMALAAWVALAAGCGSGAIDIAKTPLAGRIGGASWTMVSAESSAFLSDGSPSFFVTAYGEAITPCTNAGSSATGNLLILNIPKETGEYRLSLSLSETFYVRATGTNPDANLVATDGRMRVDEVTTTSVRGATHFSFDGNNEVDGEFTAAICPP